MDTFVYRESAGVTMLSASLTDFAYKKHAHREYAVGVTLRGIQHYTMDGALRLSHRSGVMLFNPEQAHDGMAHDEQGLDYVMLYIDPELMAEATDRPQPFSFDEPIVYDSGLRRHVLNLCSAISRDQGEALSSELLMSLTERLARIHPERVPAKKEHRMVDQAKEMLQADLSGVLKLDQVAAALRVSKFRLIRSFRAHTGISPYQYFLNAKIERAKQILRTEQDVYMAVAACGFTDLAHLNRHFKSVYGITAFEYLANIRGPVPLVQKLFRSL